MMVIKQICVILNINFNINVLWKNWEVKAFIKHDQTVKVESNIWILACNENENTCF